jgi:hypothetical protein
VNDAAPITEWRDVDRAVFEHEIVPRAEPAVLRGLVSDWPLVQLARQSDLALAQWLVAHAGSAEVDALMLAPQQRGRIFYGEGFARGERDFNYLRNRLPLARVLEQVLRYAHFPTAPAVAVQSAPVADCLPAFTAAHTMPLLAPAVAPRLWLGNAIVTPAHFDESSNIACVVAGRRRFTLFPPEQVGNLYIGPLGHAPTGTPISLVDFAAPDFERFPRFAQALAAARAAELAPGDAIYIPPLWWHHVASLAPLNLLVNYWWRAPALPSGVDALMQALAAYRAMPAPQRRAWQALFAHWVFEADDETLAHIPPAHIPLALRPPPG